MQSRPVLYSRDLPGGGYVVIDAFPDDRGHHARLWVERRGDPARRAGHLPPVVAESDARDAASAVAELQPIAADNLALAQAIRSWQLANRRV